MAMVRCSLFIAVNSCIRLNQVIDISTGIPSKRYRPARCDKSFSSRRIYITEKTTHTNGTRG